MEDRLKNHQEEHFVHLMILLIEMNLQVLRKCKVKFNKQPPGRILKKLFPRMGKLKEVI